MPAESEIDPDANAQGISITEGGRDGESRLFLQYGGNIGIGTTTPTQRLDVNGKIRVRDLAPDATLEDLVVTDADGNLYVE